MYCVVIYKQSSDASNTNSSSRMLELSTANDGSFTQNPEFQQQFADWHNNHAWENEILDAETAITKSVSKNSTAQPNALSIGWETNG